ncbi:tellurite resistance TerB family protein [Marinobacterium lutimaris]|uniref:Uncharacterized membrane protein YebE, DUF533 family n=1 Tax=Marinobacterium lutimaris TaxID=568106 RepID=A0A1H5XYX7_9GAMM|nr:tellurite resistance TerB family protein [Marinobacterium lutimaris]SEG16888.1 Uncharacterized membrane protein YebE, DUF533 family [Marinobacterium lutimaris]
MNASQIFQQLMQQSSGQSGGFDPKGLLDSVSRQLGGGQGSSGGQSSGGIDIKSLLGGGALGLLIGSKRGRKLGGSALKYGAIAGVGALAWRAWQNAQQSQASAAPTAAASEGQPIEQLSHQAQEQRSLELLQAMIMAARADGHIDARETELITEQMEQLGADAELQRWVEQQLQAPLDATALAAKADSPQAAREIYLVSLAIVDEQSPMERAWLDQLAQALALDADMRLALEQQAQSAAG